MAGSSRELHYLSDHTPVSSPLLKVCVIRPEINVERCEFGRRNRFARRVFHSSTACERCMAKTELLSKKGSFYG